MSDKPKSQVYEVPWKIEGRWRCEATSQAEANRLFDARFDPRDDAEKGDLESYDAELFVED